MADSFSLWIMWGVIAALIALMGVVGIGIMRSRNGFNLVILRDYRMNKKFDRPRALKLVIDSKGGATKQGKLYKSWVSIWQADNPVWELPDLRPYVYDKIVYAVRGITGNPDDDNFVFVPLPYIGQIGSMDYSSDMSDQIYQRLSAKLGTVNFDELKEKLKNPNLMKELLQDTFDPKWVASHLGMKPITMADVLPRQYKSFFANRLEKEKSFANARMGAWDKLLQYLPVLALSIMFICVGIGYYQIMDANAVMVKATQQYSAQQYTWLNTQNWQISRALALAGVYGYNATTNPPPLPPNTTGIGGVDIPTIPTVPKV